MRFGRGKILKGLLAAFAVLDDGLQQGAAVVDREDLGPRLLGLDQRVMQLVERQRVIEQRGVDDAARDGELARRDAIMAWRHGVLESSCGAVSRLETIFRLP